MARRAALCLASTLVFAILTTPPTALAQHAWQASFTLTDTSYGKKSALLDNATHLDWLRLSATRNKSQEELRRIMATPGRNREAWRFATGDEVVLFFRHFLASPDGTTTDPAAEQELQRLMGGPLGASKNPIGGWPRNFTIGRIAGYSNTNYAEAPIRAGRFQYHYAYIGEEIADGHQVITVDPRKYGYVDGDTTSPDTGTFLVREH